MDLLSEIVVGIFLGNFDKNAKSQQKGGNNPFVSGKILHTCSNDFMKIERINIKIKFWFTRKIYLQLQ